ncbi:class I SAM-dependent methyltransferase [Rhodococcus aerolatus]
MSLPPEYFDAVYAGAADPWGFTDRWYEARKRALTLAALPAARYGRALEPGCSIGVLTAELAARCDAVLATDVTDAPLAAARERVDAAGVGARVELRRAALGEAWPAGPFDLVVLSEVLYYLDAATLRATLDGLPAVLAPGATVLGVHWRHRVADYPQRGDEVHAALRATPGLHRLGGWSDEDVVLDVLLAGGDTRSVATRAGLTPRGLTRPGGC